MWLVAVIDNSLGCIGWPTEDVEIQYAGRTFTLRPESGDLYADIITEFTSNNDRVQVEGELLRFCSMVAWVENGSVSILSLLHSGDPIPDRMARQQKVSLGHFTISKTFQSDPQLQLMFALYREALSVNSPLFAFFGFFKILNTRLSGDDQKTWIVENLSRITDDAAQKRIAQLSCDREDVGARMYNDLRTAVVHASVKHNVNPDDPVSVSRLMNDLPLMKALAELFIEDAVTLVSTPLP